MSIRWMMLAALVLMVGCDDVATTSGPADTGPPPPPGAPAPAAASDDQPVSAVATVKLRSGEEVTSSIKTEGGNELVVAEKGVGQKGRSLDEHEGMIVTPIKSLFAVQQRVIFEIQLPQAMNLYEATNGKAPQTHEEFMQKIVNFNKLELPELPPGHRYRYDPKLKELLVERPKPKS